MLKEKLICKVCNSTKFTRLEESVNVKGYGGMFLYVCGDCGTTRVPEACLRYLTYKQCYL